MSKPRQIFAFSGVLTTAADRKGSFALLEHALSLTQPSGRTKVCYIPTGVGDSAAAVEDNAAKFGDRRDIEHSVLTLFTQPNVADVRTHLMSQDLLLVEGGSVANLMAVWRVHGLPEILRQCWESGVVMAGASAGSLCWHLGGPTDSFGDELAPWTDGLGFLPYSNGVHDDFDNQARRRAYRQLVADGALAPGYATEDGVGLHYVDTELAEAVCIRSGKRAWWVEPGSERAIDPRRL